MKNKFCYLLALGVIVADQLSKYLASYFLIPYHPETVLPILNITLAYNSGAAFGFLSSMGEWHRWFFAGFSAVMSMVLIIWLSRTATSARLQCIALACILGGALGNLIDRAFFGYVVDFIDLYYKNYHWPVFNIADSAICIGAGLLFISACRESD